MCTSTNITVMALFLNFYDVALSKVDFYDLKTWGVTTSSTWNNKKQTLNKPILGLEFFLFFIKVHTRKDFSLFHLYCESGMIYSGFNSNYFNLLNMSGNFRNIL